MRPWAFPSSPPNRHHSHLAHSRHCYRQVYSEFCLVHLLNHSTMCFLRIGLVGISDEQLAAAPFTGWRLYIRHVRRVMRYHVIIAFFLQFTMHDLILSSLHFFLSPQAIWVILRVMFAFCGFWPVKVIGKQVDQLNAHDINSPTSGTF